MTIQWTSFVLVFVVVGSVLVWELEAQLVPGDVTIVARSLDSLQCGKYRCLNEAKCNEQQECECPQDSSGDGRFLCYTSNHTRIQVVSNTLASSAHLNAEDGVPINWPCTYRLTRVKTRGNDAVDSCDMQVFGMHKVLNGEVVLHGVQVYLVITMPDKQKVRLAFRKTASARTSIYKYDEWSKEIEGHEHLYKRQATGDELDGSGSGDGVVFTKRFSPFIDDEDSELPVSELWGPSRTLHVASEKVKFAVDPDSFSVLALSSCGIHLKLRPTLEGAAKGELAGLAITVDRNYGPVSFPDSKTYLNGNVCPFCGNYNKRAVVMPAATQEDVFLSVLKYAAPQDDPTDQGEQCENVINTYGAFCTNTPDKKVKVCHKLLANKGLMKCMAKLHSPSSSSNSVLGLVGRCLRRVCDQSEMACRLARTDLLNAGCETFWPQVLKTMGCPYSF